MNLLFILPAYEPAWPFGGVVRCISFLCRGLADLGHKITVYTINADGAGGRLEVPQGQPVLQGGVSTYFFPSTFGSGSVWDSRSLIRRLRRTIKDFDLVYVSAIWQWLGIATSSICEKYKFPLIIGAHGSFDKALMTRGRLKKTIFWHLFLHRAISRATALHLTTEYERNESLDLLGRFDKFIIPNGLDVDYFRPLSKAREKLRRRLGIALDAPVVITVGRPDPKKRVDLLIRALPRNPALNLLVVGSDTEELALSWKALARELNVADRVIWTGFLSGEDLVEVYSLADIFALISNDENFGMVVAEAMSCGQPILVTPGVGIWEEVKTKEVGRQVALDGEAIAQALEHFVYNRAVWMRWGGNARRVAIENFSKDKVASLMEKAFHDVIHGTRSGVCRWQLSNVEILKN